MRLPRHLAEITLADAAEAVRDGRALRADFDDEALCEACYGRLGAFVNDGCGILCGACYVRDVAEWNAREGFLAENLRDRVGAARMLPRLEAAMSALWLAAVAEGAGR